MTENSAPIPEQSSVDLARVALHAARAAARSRSADVGGRSATQRRKRCTVKVGARGPAAVAADKAYSSRANRAYLRRRRIRAVIPEKTDQAANRKKKGCRGGRPIALDAGLYRDRNTVERCINKIKEWRGLATRYDKTPASYLAGLHLRGAVIWLRSLT